MREVSDVVDYVTSAHDRGCQVVVVWIETHKVLLLKLQVGGHTRFCMLLLLLLLMENCLLVVQLVEVSAFLLAVVGERDLELIRFLDLVAVKVLTRCHLARITDIRDETFGAEGTSYDLIDLRHLQSILLLARLVGDQVVCR